MDTWFAALFREIIKDICKQCSNYKNICQRSNYAKGVYDKHDNYDMFWVNVVTVNVKIIMEHVQVITTIINIKNLLVDSIKIRSHKERFHRINFFIYSLIVVGKN